MSKIAHLLPLLILLAAECITAMYPSTARLGMVKKSTINGDDFDINLPPEFEIYNYTQTLDHFNYKPESYNTFQQRYIVNSKYWGGGNTSSPIFVYMGDEADVTLLAYLAGFMVELASRFKGLLVYIEHRYYGESLPFGFETFENGSTLGFLSSTQAMADYAQLITHLKWNLSAQNCPVIATGGSYGGMLASWFRLKYPHVAYGALAASAPILYFDDITPQNGFHVIVSKDFNDTSESCYNTIRQSWFEIDKLAAQSNGLLNLSRIFNTCQTLRSSQELKNFVGREYATFALHDNPPYYLVERVCNAIDGAAGGTDILGRIAAGFSAIFGPECIYMRHEPNNNSIAWTWQTCTEMVMPIGHGANDTMFQANPFDLNNFTKNCEALFGVTPRPHWITTEFGGHDIKSVLGNFASNIIFSNGLRDPYSAGGVLQNISDSVVAVYTEKGAHCLDLATPMASDPAWLVSQRNTEIKIIQGWIAQYNATKIPWHN